MRTVWQIVRRITNEILGVKGLTSQFALCRNPSNILSEKESDIVEYVFDNTGKFNMMFNLKPDSLLEKKYFTWSMQYNTCTLIYHFPNFNHTFFKFRHMHDCNLMIFCA